MHFIALMFSVRVNTGICACEYVLLDFFSYRLGSKFHVSHSQRLGFNFCERVAYNIKHPDDVFLFLLKMCLSFLQNGVAAL